jgi:hypothetical protein
MVATKSTEDVLREIERDLKADERIWKRVDRDLAALGGPARRRTDLIVAGVVGLLVLLAGAFALGWNLAPSTSGTAVAAVSSPTRFTSSGLAEKRAAFEARYGTSESAMDPGLWPPVGGGSGSAMTQSGLAEKRAAFEARYGTSEAGSAGASGLASLMSRADYDTWARQHGNGSS